ncbi:hypothetical protein GCM10007082_30230 [Oceanisphaera arctica]|nr:hypothetical protein GCM10007082_30230 [Oceanisphaera arctica]
MECNARGGLGRGYCTRSKVTPPPSLPLAKLRSHACDSAAKGEGQKQAQRRLLFP